MNQPTFDFGNGPAGDEPVDPDEPMTFSVAELANAINAQLRRGFSDGVWVRGEIDGLRHSGAHTYFSLVEHGDDGRAVLNVSLFAPAKRRLTPLLKRSRLELANGVKVRIRGALDYYAPNGRLGLKMADIDPRFTLGELSQERDRVVRRLVASGRYDANRRLPVPLVPLRIGIVTSVGTAAWHDFHDELDASGFGFVLRVCDVRVQGDGADRMIAAAISTLGRRRDVDVIVVIRGGGARNELATFDAEAIAVAIADSPLPVYTGLGHETDRSVADEVAGLALKTPTACAGRLVADVATYIGGVEQTWSAIESRARASIASHGERLEQTTRRVSMQTSQAVGRADERLRTRVARLAVSGPRALIAADEHLARSAIALDRSSVRSLDGELARHDDRARRLALLDPANLLRRGWSITRTADGSVVSSTVGLAPGDLLTTQLADGTVTSRIEEP